jgi:DNA repair protein RadD
MRNALPLAGEAPTTECRNGDGCPSSTPSPATPASRNTPQLRPYQQQGVDEIRAHFANGVSRVCYQLPTGGGKTIAFAFVVAAAVAKGSRVLVLVHRIELVEQIAATLDRFGVEYGLIVAGYPAVSEAPVQIASVYTLVRRLDTIGEFDLVVLDEAHHAVASTWRDILNAVPRAKALGVSATPERSDGKGLDDIFEALVLGPTMRWLIDEGHLAQYVAYGPEKAPDLKRIKVTAGDFNIGALAGAMGDKVVIDAAVSEYKRLCPDAPGIAFCVDIDHSKKVAQAFCDAGVRAAHVDGETPREERRDLIASLADGRVQVLANCGLISEGLDVPGVVAAILLRPTMSRALYLQQVGRALRPGKPRAFILDHAGSVLRHGLPDAPYEWSLEGRPKEDRSRDRSRQCESCGAFSAYTATCCSECGRAFLVRETKAPEKIDVASTLVEIKSGPELSPTQMEAQSKWVPIDGMTVHFHAKPGKTPTLRVQYRSGRSTYYEWLAIQHGGYGRDLAVRRWQRLGGRPPVPTTVAEAISRQRELATPDAIFVERNGKYWSVVSYRTSAAAVSA